MSKLEKAKEIITKYSKYADCGIYDTRNIAGDFMETVHCDDDLQIDICYGWNYFEVFGLSDEEFDELREFYYDLVKYFD